MRHSIIETVASIDAPEIDVLFYNMTEDWFVRRITSDIMYDLTKEKGERRGIKDENINAVLFDIPFLIEKHMEQHDNEPLKAVHRYYKRLMTKAILKEPFTKEEIQNLEFLFNINPKVTIEAQNGKLIVSKTPQPFIINRLAEGVVDVQNGNKDIRICAASDCDIAFAPKRKDHIYHSRTCSTRMHKRLERQRKSTVIS
ncbi:CGNR zinc finger domain-containing protein [bacterium]|nr:CGNR zinc finger domain-containing protein [bacterium]